MTRTSTSDHETKAWAVYPHWYLRNHAHGDFHFQTGNYPSVYGIVEVHCDNHGTRMKFIWGGREWCRYWNRPWGKKTLSRLARKFAFEIANNEASL